MNSDLKFCLWSMARVSVFLNSRRRRGANAPSCPHPLSGRMCARKYVRVDRAKTRRANGLDEREHDNIIIELSNADGDVTLSRARTRAYSATAIRLLLSSSHRTTSCSGGSRNPFPRTRAFFAYTTSRRG